MRTRPPWAAAVIRATSGRRLPSRSLATQRDLVAGLFARFSIPRGYAAERPRGSTGHRDVEGASSIRTRSRPGSASAGSTGDESGVGRYPGLRRLQARRSARGNAREFDRQLPLREEVADQTVIRRILAGLDRVVGPIRIGSRGRSVGARQCVETRPTKRDGRVEREHRANQEMSNDSRHRNIVDRR